MLARILTTDEFKDGKESHAKYSAENTAQRKYH